MKLVVAVSGGVDSVVLLDMLVAAARGKYTMPQNGAVKVQPSQVEIIVAHFDHGIREDSAEDARFVEGLAKKYGLPFETRCEELGSGASEELARTRRYAFLQEVANKYEATITTAHHMNDVAETIAINLTRGTGWRGLAVLGRDDIYRPLLGKTKQELIAYALEHRLEWCEDSTNRSDVYLRNRLRRNIRDETMVRRLAALRDKQIAIKQEVYAELGVIVGDAPHSRYFMSQIEPATAVECLHRLTSDRLTRPQAERLLLAIKTHKPGSQYEAGAGIKVHFTTRHFSLEMIK